MPDENLIREFIAEAEEHLFILEPNLLRLEKESQNLELVNEIFIATHGIKGTASYVGLAHISSFTHAMETLLDHLRKQVLQVTPELIDALLAGVDTLKALIRSVSQDESPPDTSAVLAQFARWNMSDSPSESPPSSSLQDRRTAMNTPSSNAGFLPDGLDIDAEDAEIFLDIAGQQLEFMSMALERIHALPAEDAGANQEQMRDLVSTLTKACRAIQSSAMMLDVPPLNEGLEQAARGILALDTLEGPLDAEAATQIDESLAMVRQIVEAVTSIIEAEQVDEEGPPEQPVPNPPEPQTSVSELSPGQYTLRVSAERVDHLLNLVGELVINRARLVQIGGKIKNIYEDLRTEEGALRGSSSLHRKKDLRFFKGLKENFDEVILDLGRLTNQIQEGTMRIRMIPIHQIVNRFPRMVRDLSREAGKEVQIDIYGADTELDKTVIDVIGDPLIHIIRNAIDHGIESPDERRQQGKPLQGRLILSAYHQGNQVIIEVQDDGRGINTKRVKHKAIEQQILSAQEADLMSERDMAYLVFHSGFSTAETVSNLSGRGVGLNVVKRYLEKLNGAIELDTVEGKGCKFTLKLPLTLAIIPALMVSVQQEIFAIPLISVEEAIRIQDQEVKTIESHQVIRLRDRMVPLVDLAEILGTPVFTQQKNQQQETRDKNYGVIISDGFREIGLLIDALLGESDIVIKSLDDELVNVEGVSGASIRGDGEVSLVLDAVSLINLTIKHIRHTHHTRPLSDFFKGPEREAQ